MKVPFLDLKSQYRSIKHQIDEAIQEVIDSTAFASGPFVEKFEKHFSNYLDAAHCIGVNSGTSALHLALIASGVEESDEVILPAHTFVSTAWAVSYVGAKPVFVDIDPELYTIDVNKIEEKINAKTKAIIPVHLYGQPADMDPVMDIAKKHGLTVIEDAAQAQGAEYKGRKCGTIGDIGCFSFYPGKNLGAYGEAGAVTTNDPDLAETVKLYRDHCQKKKYQHFDVGYNYRMDGIQGAVLSVKLCYLDQWNEQRRGIAGQYNDALKYLPNSVLPKEAGYARHVYHQYELRLDKVVKRDDLREKLNEKGIGTGLHYPIPLHIQEAFDHLGYKPGDFPEAENTAKRSISLPIHPEMTREMVKYTYDSILEILS